MQDVPAAVRGRLYEGRVLRLLAGLGMRLAHVGGRGDGGIDLRGRWGGPCGPAVAVQCKRIARPCPPDVVRELEGTLQRMHSALRSESKAALPSALGSWGDDASDSSIFPPGQSHPSNAQESARALPLAVLAVSSPASDAARAAVATSPLPIVYMHIPDCADAPDGPRGEHLAVAGAIVSTAAHRAFPALRVGSRRAGGTSSPTFEWFSA